MSPVHFEIRGDTYTVTCGDDKLVTKSKIEAIEHIRQIHREQDRERAQHHNAGGAEQVSTA